MRRWAASALTSSSRSLPSRTTRRAQSALAAAARPVPKDFPPAKSTASTPGPSITIKDSRPDPFHIVAPQLAQLRTTLFNLLGSSHPELQTVAQYYFSHPSKQLRPLLVLLFAQATNGLGRAYPQVASSVLNAGVPNASAGKTGMEPLDAPLTRHDVLNDYNPRMPDDTASFSTTFALRKPSGPTGARFTPTPALSEYRPAVANTLLPTQQRLAQIVEMIHVASLLHDDVIDMSPLRRGAPSAPNAFSPKLAVLGGDFLLGRASAALARLGSNETVELIASVIANLVEGEVLQIRPPDARVEAELNTTVKVAETQGDAVHSASWQIYLQKTYMKTASLMAKGARAAVVLGGCEDGDIAKEAAYAYGRNLGIAFQLQDDVLDYAASEAQLGKPGNADLKLGLATGPALYAWEEHPEMGALIKRRFEQEGDVELALNLVRRSSGVERTSQLAQAHADKAREVLAFLPPSDARTALEALTERVVIRTW
ncbi:terpenoid synthase [Coniophora puteana RWD-64-598 SS2]|uniref:(2E,6E)-farnesyl diphosphate synthase n=1 Tax=Coniophora puteana (strain RWD-64-598) TaxID=741705 RepID=A0A5M3N6M2_CONPW|nr:terpenoid synthase [Coniophora puteana RWD-64-598 SS2]EIW87082.1 terpenoid synthase [Coniophora puteana RWD-64-598 SS2]